MKILIVGDTHFKAFAGTRSDNIRETQNRKLDEIFDIARKEEVVAIIQTGDFFDRPDVPSCVTADIARAFYFTKKCLFFTVLGQHDKYMRTGLEKSPVRIFSELDIVTVLGSEVMNCSGGQNTDPVLELYGASWGDDVPIPVDKSCFNVLVVHAPIHPDPLYPGDSGYATPRGFLSRYPDYDVIICGDYHRPFFFQDTHGRTILNPGALTRQTVADADHQPTVVLWDIEKAEFNEIEIKVDPDVFIGTLINSVKKEDGLLNKEALHSLISSLETGVGGLSFSSILNAYMEEQGISKLVREYVLSAVEDI